jgi:hypothetical protein
VFRRSGTIVLGQEREATVGDARYRLEAYATLRRHDFDLGYEEARMQDDFHTSRAGPESKVA